MHIDQHAMPSPTSAVRMRPRRSPGERLAEALMRLAGGQARIERQSEENWASITFAGTRHRFELVFEGCEAIALGEDFIAELPEHEFAIPGQLIADADITAVVHRNAPPKMTVVCELLMVEEG